MYGENYRDDFCNRELLPQGKSTTNSSNDNTLEEKMFIELPSYFSKYSEYGTLSF